MSYSIVDNNNSPNFNIHNWGHSRRVLDRANSPKANVVNVTATVARLARIQTPVTDARIEAAKVVNVETPDRKRAELLGYTVKTLRAQCKVEALAGYSKAKKATLVDMLLANTL